MLVRYLLIVLLFSSMAMADSVRLKQWEDIGENYLHLNLNELRFTNRAACASDSKKPATSTFLLLNNFFAVKGLFRLAKSNGGDTAKITKMGIEVFRKSVLQLTLHIHDKLIHGELPLLPSDMTGKNEGPYEYGSVMKRCRNGEYCRELDDYLKGLWEISNAGDDFRSYDNFSDEHFYNHPEKSHAKRIMGCYYLKKFTPIQGHLFGQKPDRKLLNYMGGILKESGKYLADCFDVDEQDHLKVATYQLDINNLKKFVWERQGFAYWNSLRLFVSWAWRNAPVVDQMMFPFANVFRGVNIEESIMFVPNGCKSLTPPKCDHEYLAMNSVRELSKTSFRKKGLKLDVLSSIPEGPQDELLNDPFTGVNNNILNLTSHDDAGKWLEHFRANVNRVRNIMKNKLITSTNFLGIALETIDLQKISKDLKEQFKRVVEGEEKGEEIDRLKNQLYYLCAEASFVANKDFSFIKNKLALLKDIRFLDGVTKQISSAKVSEYFVYYNEIAETIDRSCHKLNQKEIWDDSFTLEKEGYASWYVNKVYKNKFVSRFDDLASKAMIIPEKPYLAYKSFMTSKVNDDILCFTPSHCTRKIISSIVDIYSVTQYVYTFWDMEQKISSPALFNPYAERTACKVYDPWYKTKATMFALLSDLGQVALTATTPGYVFGSLRLQPGRVISFRQLVEEGKIKYDAKMEKEKIQMELISNFGPLLNVPCSVAISKTNYNPYNYYRFSGITIGACKSTERHNLEVVNTEDMDNDNEMDRKGCVSCSLKFVTDGYLLGKKVGQLGPVLTLLNALVSLYKNFSDKLNIPRSWTVDLNYVLDTYRRYGKVPKRCVAPLTRGDSCLKNDCSDEAVAMYHRHISAPITHMREKNGFATYFKAKGCDEVIEVSTWSDMAHAYDEKSCSAMSIKIPESCKEKIGK